MKLKILSGIVISALSLNIYAGNADRSGSAGAQELLINPFARSSGWGGANQASIRGLESMQYNIAGMAFTKKTELVFANTQYLWGSGIAINNFGLSQKVGESGVLGVCISAMSFGDIEITKTDLPEGNIGKFSPTLMNINLAYSKAFSNSIYGGINLKVITESISNVDATGAAIDAGVQYVTGDEENIKFGISMRNVGPRMKYSGDGLSFRGYVPGAANAMTVEQRSQDYELPSLINIGGAYDFLFHAKSGEEILYRATLAGNFTSNSFTNDQYALGLELSYKDLLMLRGAYTYEDAITKDITKGRKTFLTGPSVGATFELPLNKEKGTTIGIDYSLRFTNPFDGIHSFGVRISL